MIVLTIKQNWKNSLLGLLLATIFSLITYQGSSLIPPILFVQEHSDIWFEADLPRVFENMSIRESYHGRDKVHPLFGLVSYPPVFILKNVFSMEPITAVRLVIASVAFIWTLLLFILFQAMGCRLLNMILFTLLGMLSAASMFLFVVPETYSFGSATIITALLFTIISQKETIRLKWYVLINILTASITTTNWMAGILATLVNHRLKMTAIIITSAFAAITALWGVQKQIFVTSKFFLDVGGEVSFIFRAGTGGPIAVLQSFFYHTIIMPAIRIVEESGRPDWPGMYTQLSLPGSATIWGGCAVIIWTILLIIGLWSLFSLKVHSKFRTVLGFTLLGQLALHLIYGTEIFIYSLHFNVLLIPLVALGSLTQMRTVVTVLTCLLIPCVAINNFTQFYEAIDFLVQHDTMKLTSSGILQAP
jgi:hypothetical protein